MTMVTGADAAFLDLLDPDFRPDSPQVQAARELNWYARPAGNCCTAPRRVRRAAARPQAAPGFVEHAGGMGVSSGPFADWMRELLLNLEGEAHTRQRALVAAPSVAARWRRWCRSCADRA